MYLTYIRRELRRRFKQSLVIALGLAVGIALVVTVSSAAAGVKSAQGQVLHSLYGVGTDMTVTRSLGRGSVGPQRFGGFGSGPSQGGTRAISRNYLATWNRLYGSRHVACRLANVYGPRQLPGLEGGVVAIFLDRLRKGGETEIFGDGCQTRDFVYVADVARAFLAAAEADVTGVYNVATGLATSVLDLHRFCVEAAGVDQEPRFSPERTGDIQHSVLDTKRTERELGWRAETILAAGLARTWQWPSGSRRSAGGTYSTLGGAESPPRD